MGRLNFSLRQTPGYRTQLGVRIPHSAVAVDSLPDNKPIHMGAGSCTQFGNCFKATLIMLCGDQIPVSLPTAAHSQMLGWRTSTQLQQAQGAVQVTQDLALGVEA